MALPPCRRPASDQWSCVYSIRDGGAAVMTDRAANHEIDWLNMGVEPADDPRGGLLPVLVVGRVMSGVALNDEFLRPTCGGIQRFRVVGGRRRVTIDPDQQQRRGQARGSQQRL